MQNTFKLRNKCFILINSSLITVFKFKKNKKGEFVHVFIQFFMCFVLVCLFTENSSGCIRPDDESSLATPSNTQGNIQ